MNSNTLRLIAIFAAGFVFAIGLGISGMTLPENVVGFLDVTGDWKPELMFVMGGAIAVHLGTTEQRFHLPFMSSRPTNERGLATSGRTTA